MLDIWQANLNFQKLIGDIYQRTENIPIVLISFEFWHHIEIFGRRFTTIDRQNAIFEIQSIFDRQGEYLEINCWYLAGKCIYLTIFLQHLIDK